MATVRIPPVLRSSTNGEREVDAGGENVGALLLLAFLLRIES